MADKVEKVDEAPKKADPQPTDVVLRFVGKKGAPGVFAKDGQPARAAVPGDVVTTEYGSLPQRDLTRADMPVYIRQRAWLTAVAESGVYEAVEGVEVHFPTSETPARQ